MKITVDKECCDFNCDNKDCDGAYGTKEIDIEIPTADLIAELERRADCVNCKYVRERDICDCIFMYRVNQFTPVKGEI